MNNREKLTQEWEELNKRIEEFDKELDRHILFNQIGLVIIGGITLGLVIGIWI